jgi:hypothetical protein
LTDERYRAAIRVSERLADGQASSDEARQVTNGLIVAGEERLEIDDVYGPLVPYDLLRPTFAVTHAIECAWQMAHFNNYSDGSFDGMEVEFMAEQADFVRDIFRHPSSPVRYDPRWRTTDTLGLARGIYEDRAFDRLPILADALIDAGCDDAAILGHCRGPGPHVRGCWVVDLVLGKE